MIEESTKLLYNKEFWINLKAELQDNSKYHLCLVSEDFKQIWDHWYTERIVRNYAIMFLMTYVHDEEGLKVGDPFQICLFYTFPCIESQEKLVRLDFCQFMINQFEQ